MKTRHWFISAILILSSSIAVAGSVSSVPVDIDEDNMIAIGDMWTARTADNDVEFIGCGIRKFDDGVNPSFSFGFCQAQDADEVMIFCSTFSEVLLDAMASTSDFSFITFSWNAAFECIRVGFSNQSFYLPNIKIQKGMGGGGEED